MARAPTFLLWQEPCGRVLPVERRAHVSDDTPGTTRPCELYKHAYLPNETTTPAPPTPGMPLSETGERRRGSPAPTTRVLPGRRSGRLWASLPSAEYGTTAPPTLWAAGRFPGETWPCPPGPEPFRLDPSPTVCADSPDTSGWRSRSSGSPSRWSRWSAGRPWCI